jgi:phage gp16-like protein
MLNVWTRKKKCGDDDDDLIRDVLQVRLASTKCLPSRLSSKRALLL